VVGGATNLGAIASDSGTMLVATIGCGGLNSVQDPSQGSSETSSEAPAAAVETTTTPVPVFTMELKTGNSISFYKVKGGAVVAETGAAGKSQPILNSIRQRGKQLADVFSALRPFSLLPDQDLPKALVDLQNEILTGTSASSIPSVDTSGSIEVKSAALSQAAPPDGTSTGGGQPFTPLKSGGVNPDTLIGCTNGCCDPVWTKTYLCGNPSYNDFWWYDFNYGWSYATSTDDSEVNAALCSAVGTSVLVVNGSSFPVAEGNYFNYYIDHGCGGLCDGNFNSVVNSSRNQHLHMYCGWVMYDVIF
jgi:hypothetical protein